MLKNKIFSTNKARTQAFVLRKYISRDVPLNERATDISVGRLSAEMLPSFLIIHCITFLLHISCSILHTLSCKSVLMTHDLCSVSLLLAEQYFQDFFQGIETILVSVTVLGEWVNLIFLIVKSSVHPILIAFRYKYSIEYNILLMIGIIFFLSVLNYLDVYRVFWRNLVHSTDSSVNFFHVDLI